MIQRDGIASESSTATSAMNQRGSSMGKSSSSTSSARRASNEPTRTETSSQMRQRLDWALDISLLIGVLGSTALHFKYNTSTPATVTQSVMILVISLIRLSQKLIAIGCHLSRNISTTKQTKSTKGTGR